MTKQAIANRKNARKYAMLRVNRADANRLKKLAEKSGRNQLLMFKVLLDRQEAGRY